MLHRGAKPVTPASVVALTIAALVGFAANSLLCRAAIGAHEIDPATFTAVRLVSGAVVLAVLARIARASTAWSAGAAAGGPIATASTSVDSRASAASASPSDSPIATRIVRGGSWISALALFAYAAAFSFAYVRLSTATGALLLFAFVQLSMIAAGIARGERPRLVEWAGHAMAIAGLVALALPGLAAPDMVGAVLMATAGVAWGVYSLRGRGAKNPLATTADNFARTVPMALALVGIAMVARDSGAYASTHGVLLAVASGALASGVGYSVWYAALPSLAATRAAVVQLLVPAIAAVGGVVVLGEALTVRFVACAAAILGGVAIAIAGHRRHR
jgi:drug/metabolite transporter (DMT)-like permease